MVVVDDRDVLTEMPICYPVVRTKGFLGRVGVFLRICTSLEGEFNGLKARENQEKKRQSPPVHVQVFFFFFFFFLISLRGKPVRCMYVCIYVCTYIHIHIDYGT